MAEIHQKLILGHPAQEGHGTARTGPKEAMKIRGLENHPLWEQAERIWAVQPGEENALGRQSNLPAPEGYKRAGEGLFTRVCSDCSRGNGFELGEI